jgi:hypothetical protein
MNSFKLKSEKNVGNGIKKVQIPFFQLPDWNSSFPIF